MFGDVGDKLIGIALETRLAIWIIFKVFRPHIEVLTNRTTYVLDVRLQEGYMPFVTPTHPNLVTPKRLTSFRLGFEVAVATSWGDSLQHDQALTLRLLYSASVGESLLRMVLEPLNFILTSGQGVNKSKPKVSPSGLLNREMLRSQLVISVA